MIVAIGFKGDMFCSLADCLILDSDGTVTAESLPAGPLYPGETFSVDMNDVEGIAVHEDGTTFGFEDMPVDCGKLPDDIVLWSES